MESHFLHLLPRDIPRLEELCQEQNQVDGTSYTPPQIFDREGRRLPNIPIAMKRVCNGQMTQAYIFEAVPEVMSFGLDVRSSAQMLHQELPAAMWILGQLGFRGFRSLVPLSRVDLWQKTMNKRLRMKRFDDTLAHFYRDFREASE
jgi:hypothetical protein